MIITFIIVGLLIAGIVCMVVEPRSRKCPVWVFGLGLALTLVFGMASFITSIAIIDIKVNEDIYYQNKLHEREMLEYRIDNIEDNIVGNEMIYNDIVEFNNSLRDVKKWANNPFTNWFYVKDIAEIDYIEINNE